MSEPKTTINDGDAREFIDSVDDTTKRADSVRLLDMYERVTGEPARMWGSSIVGFGRYHYKSERSAQEGDWMLIGFSPRKQNLTLYFMNGFDDLADQLSNLGKHKTSKGCLYINKLDDVDLKVLERLVTQSYQAMKNSTAK